MKWNLIIIIFILILTPSILAISFSPYERFNEWRWSVHGNESILFNHGITIEGNQICLTPVSLESIVVQESQCLEYNKDGEDCIVTEYKNVTYDIADWKNVPLKDSEGSILRNINQDFNVINFFNTIHAFNHQICIDLDPLESLYYSLGFQTIIIQGDTEYDSNSSDNVTQETGFAHLNISTQSPYDSLIGYWSFDGDIENTESTTSYDYTDNNYDTVGNGNAVVNETSCLTGYGDCLQLDGTGDFVDNSDQIIPSTEDFSVSSWVSVNNIATTVDAAIIGQGIAASNEIILYGSTDAGSANGNIRLFMRTNNAGVEVLVGPDIRNTGWRHVLITRSGTDCNLYVDGAFDTSGTCGEDSIDSHLRIGAAPNNGDADRFFMDGRIDEVMVFNITLDNQTILDIYRNQSSRFANNGTLLFENLELGTNVTANVTINSTQTLKGSSLEASLDNGGNWTAFSGTLASDVHINNPSNANLTIRLLAGNSTDPFYTPITFGNMTVEGNGAGEAPPEDSCTYSSGDWDVECSDNCRITEDVDLGNNDLYLRGSGEFITLANITNVGSIIKENSCTLYSETGATIS